MPEHFADRLLEAIGRKGSPVCVGLDPDAERLPAGLAGGEPLRRLEEFCLRVIEAVAAIVPAVKPQSAYFERYGAAGVAAYERVVAAGRSAGLIVIGDVKRNDIGPTAAQYAAGHLARAQAPDAITVNAYFGADGLTPFIEAAAGAGRGVFVLVRTSNPSAAGVQDFTDSAGRKFYEHLARQVAALGRGEAWGGSAAPWGRSEWLLGRRGYSCVGAVVGATYPAEAGRLRELMPQQVFLVPGYGAQGATAADCAAAFKPDGTGAIVNASRSVLYPTKDPRFATADWPSAVADAARAFAQDIRRVLSGQ